MPNEIGAKRSASGQPKRQAADPQVEYKDHVTKMFLQNKNSACELKQFLNKAARAGAEGTNDLVRPTLPRNAQRSLIRTFLKGTDAPNVYWVQVPMHDPQTKKDGELGWLPVLLPHELIYHLIKLNPSLLSDLLEERMAPGVMEIVEEFADEHGIPIDKLLLLGHFGDGVPHQKNKTVECLSWNFASLGAQSNWYLFGLCPKEFCCKCGCAGRHTIDALLAS